MQEEITPKLDKLREEKRSFLEYQRATSELERLTRLAKAHEWQNLNQKAEERNAHVLEQRAKVEKSQTEVGSLQHQIRSIEEELQGIEKRKEREIAKGGKLKALLEKSKSLQHELVKAKTTLDFKIAGIEEEKKKISADENALTALRTAKERKSKDFEKTTSSFSATKEAYDAAIAEMTKEDELLQSLLTGMASKSSGKSSGFMGQLADARSAEGSARTETEQAKVRISHLEKELKAKEPQAKKAEKEGAGLLQQLEAAKSDVDRLSSALAASGWDENEEKELLNRKSTLSKEVSRLLEIRDQLKSRLAGVDFSYSDPEANFDRTRVKGLVASLVDLKEENHKYSTALEICAGGRLYNVVVEDEVTGSKLLSHGKLKKRVTLIPLNKINALVAASQRIGAAQKIAGDPSKVDLALNLVGYEEDVSKAMEYVFGNTLICADAQTAKRVTFDNQVRMKSVTLDGDVYDPAGTLSGGSKPQSGGLLVKVQELRGVEKQISSLKQELAAMERDEKGSQAETAKWSKAKRELDLKRHEVGLLEQRVSGSNSTRVIGEVQAAKEAIVQLQEKIALAKENQKVAAAEIKRLEKEMGEFESNKDSKIDELKARVKTMKASIQKQSASVKSRQNEIRTRELELEGSDSEVREAEVALQEAKDAAASSQQELSQMEQTLKGRQAEADSTEAQLTREKAALSAFDEEIGSLQTAMKTKKQDVADIELELKKLTHGLDKAEQEYTGLVKGYQAIEAQFEWILEEKQ